MRWLVAVVGGCVLAGCEAAPEEVPPLLAKQAPVAVSAEVSVDVPAKQQVVYASFAIA